MLVRTGTDEAIKAFRGEANDAVDGYADFLDHFSPLVDDSAIVVAIFLAATRVL